MVVKPGLQLANVGEALLWSMLGLLAEVVGDADP